MSSEQIIQNNLMANGSLNGESYGRYEKLKLGATTVGNLLSAGLAANVASTVEFPFKKYKPLKSTLFCKPDNLIVLKVDGKVRPIAIEEYKKPSEIKSADGLLKACEQALYAAVALDVKVSVVTDGVRYIYVDVNGSLEASEIITKKEYRSFSPSILDEFLLGGQQTRDPGELAEKVWQMIWHATKEEPKACLLTFVEIFVLKFLSDNLPSSILPKNQSFYELIRGQSEFYSAHGCSPIEHYINSIRPKIKQIFPDNTISKASHVASIFGLNTIISKTSVINGFSFMKNSASSPVTYNRVFLEILDAFNEFGPLTSIDPEFKLRLYETFLKRSARQQKLGQFFTPRNVVKSVIKMARMDGLSKDAVVLDPACGVGGFILEPLITVDKLAENIKFSHGLPRLNVKLIGVDVDPNTHILGKANLLIHMVEKVRDPSVTPDAINQLMAEMLVLMNTNETLGSLEYPPRASVDLIMTNPPYVTQGSRIYRDELKNVSGQRNELDLQGYYDGTGLGLESLFLRYISGALKPGGKAFVIVPQGMLTRSETSTKELILNECNLLGSVALPSNTFFNTPQKTYIIALEKRFSKSDSRPDVLCAIARSIGESLDYRRTPIDENDLSKIADEFVAYFDKVDNARKSDEPVGYDPSLKYMKLVSSDNFTKIDRWDSVRLWSSEELVELGVLDAPIGRIEFIEDAEASIPSLLADLKSAKKDLESLTKTKAARVSINSDCFTLRRGKRVRKEDCDLNPGDINDQENPPIPVYSGTNIIDKKLGSVGRKWLIENKIPIENIDKNKKGTLTINSNGSVGVVFVRYKPCVIHDDVTIVEVNRDDIDLEYLATQLRSSITEGNYEYEAKLYSGRMKDLSVVLPLSNDGSGYDLAAQKKIAEAYKRFEVIRGKLADFGKWAGTSRMKNDNYLEMAE